MDAIAEASVPPAATVDSFMLIRKWMDYLEVSGEANVNTRRQYRRLVLDFLAETLQPLQGVTEDDVVAYLAAIPAQGHKRGMALRALRSFYRFAEPRELVGINPVRRMKVTKPRVGLAPTLTPDELQRILTAAETVDPRARWTLQLAYATGARLGSLVEVTASDIRLDPEPYLSFRVAKGDRPYGVPLGPTALEAVAELMKLADYVPPKVATRRPTLVGVGTGTVWKWARLAGDRAGVPLHPHLLRHAYGTRLAENGVDIRSWIELMGHADASQFRRYAHPSDANLRAAVQLL